MPVTALDPNPALIVVDLQVAVTGLATSVGVESTARRTDDILALLEATG